MYQKLNQNKTFKIFLSTLASLMLFAFVALFPYKEVEAVNALGIWYGGRIVSYIPGYAWTLGVTYGVCPPHMHIISFGAPYRGPLAITVPPVVPKAFYNYYTPGNAVKGGYYPGTFMIYPGPISCPDAPLLYLHSLGGTSIK